MSHSDYYLGVFTLPITPNMFVKIYVILKNLPFFP